MIECNCIVRRSEALCLMCFHGYWMRGYLYSVEWMWGWGEKEERGDIFFHSFLSFPLIVFILSRVPECNQSC